MIEPKKAASLNVKELWEYKELLYFFVWRNLKVRYKQTIFGVAWVIAKPLLLMLVFSLVFGKLAKLPSEGSPYPLFVFCAILAWDLFANTFSRTGASLLMNRGLLTKIYFPRIIIPLGTTIEGIIDFFVSSAILLIMMFFYGIKLKSAIIFFPALIALAAILSLGVGLWLSALNVKYRDINFIMPFLAQLWFYLSPVAYALSLVPEKWLLVYGLNPMVGIIEGFRWSVLGQTGHLSAVLPLSIVITAIIFISGVFYFYKVEKTFADVI